MSVLLEALKSEVTALSAKIATFEAQSKVAAAFPITINFPALNAGERYVGAIVRADGLREHIILLPGDNDGTTWKKQMDWANSIGGDLPNRVEQALLFATMKDEFKGSYYWSNTLTSDSGCAWSQDFDDGSQNCSSVGSDYRARAVRRVSF